jgi:hypothetical protein
VKTEAVYGFKLKFDVNVFPPSVAVMTTALLASNGSVQMGKVALVAPAGTVTARGTAA